MTQPTLWIIGKGTSLDDLAVEMHSCGLYLIRGDAISKKLNALGIPGFEELKLPSPGGDLQQYFDEVLQRVEKSLKEKKDVIYGTTISPFSADVFVKQLVNRFSTENIRWCSGEDITADQNIQTLFWTGYATAITDGFSLAGKHHLPVDPGQTNVIYSPTMGMDLQKLVKLTQEIYTADHTVAVYTGTNSDSLDWKKVKVNELQNVDASIEAMILPARAADASLVSFEELIAHLRAPEGCPWDRKQTHDSLRKYLLEETYEALDALDQKDMDGLREELGDILLQILLHAQIATENGDFNMAEIIEGINCKLVFRHPHVFGDAAVDGVKGVLQNWEKLKEQERAENGKDAEKGLLDGIPQSFPALAQAQAIQDRAARVGFDWKEIEPVMAKVMEEYEEVQSAPNEEERAKELGDLLFAVVNLVRWYKVDAESALRGTNLKFRRRFSYIEKKSKTIGKPMQEMSLEEMDHYWDEAKQEE